MIRVFTCSISILYFALFAYSANGAELDRRAFLGAAISAAPDGAGVRIDRVIPNSTASAAGLAAGDVVTVLDGKAVKTSGDLIGVLRGRKGGQALSLSYIRDGKAVARELTFVGAPLEVSADFETIYEAVSDGGELRRTVVTKPSAGGKLPAVLFVGGIGCYAVDAPSDEKDSYRQLIAQMTRQGFATMRVEKSGVGDSQGPACMNVDLYKEIGGYVAGLNDLKSKPYVDPERVFVVGHSIGGIVGPMVAARSPVKGIVAIATVGSSWFEYELINRRRQLALSGEKATAIAHKMLLKTFCMERLLIERQDREALLADRPECETETQYPASDAYMRDLAKLNFPEIWTKLDAKALLAYGASDYVTSRKEHQLIVDAVNAARPNSATYVEIADMDHGLTRASSQEESYANGIGDKPSEYNPAIGDAVTGWLKSQG